MPTSISSVEPNFIDMPDAATWESWLSTYQSEKSVWLRIAKKDSGKSSITIPQALDVALCFGWIDGHRKGYDDCYFLQRYTPRRPKSPWSLINVEKAMRLMKDGRMRPHGLAAIHAAQSDGRWAAAYASQRIATVPADFSSALDSNPVAKKVFGLMDRSAQYEMYLPMLKASSPNRRADLLSKAIAKLQACAVLP